ncbi:MAG: SapC family protein [bacterium]|nr:hypothetical protein [Gammaproteobacteria bacterium]HIL97510.1 hypothetical protein [Pseudomonadales bacterium]
MASLLFYDKPVALNKTAHKNKKIRPEANSFGFASNTNSVILAGVEFTEAAKEYPVVFAQSGESIVPVALLGLRNEENLFINSSGGWAARYIPAFIRRYPFVLANSEDPATRMVCIDESYAGFNNKEGEPLFVDGEPSKVLRHALDFLEEYQRQYMRTEKFVDRLRDNDLLTTLNAKIHMVDGQEFTLTGLLAVDEKRLLQLSDEQALELFKSGELAWVYCHLMSLGNISSLVNRMAKNAVADKAVPAVQGKKAGELLAIKKAAVKEAAIKEAAIKKAAIMKAAAKKANPKKEAAERPVPEKSVIGEPVRPQARKKRK